VSGRLNPKQEAAVRHVGGPLLVLAGAGSGKTRVITHKIAHLIRSGVHAPHQIAAVTFTNKAAREMRARVASLLHTENTRGLTVCTFHTLGLNILRREHRPLGYKTGFSLFDAQDSEALLKELLRKHGEDASTGARSVQWQICEWKSALLSPEHALSRADDELQAQAARLYGEYQRSLRAYNAVDFDDLIGLPTQLFRDHPEALERWRARIRYLLVDEYQDTNGAQYELVRQLVGSAGRLTVVGDDDQSIYAWRGARPENLAQLRQDFPGLEVIMLEQNYRSTGGILHAANQLIANNPHVFEKRLWSDLGAGDPIRVITCKDEEHEAQKVVSEILHQRFTGGDSYGDFAILYRGNHQARVFEKVLHTHAIPYFLSGGTSFFSRTEVKDLMAYLRLLANPDDDAAYLRVVNVPRREIGPGTLERLGAYAHQRGLALLRASAELGLEQHLGDKARTRLRAFAALVERYGRQATAGDPVHAVSELVEDIDYRGWIRETSTSDKAAERRGANLEELISWLDSLRKGALKQATLAELVGRLSLMDVLERQDEEQGGDRVHLMTLHAAKGLEFPHVFLVGMEEELLPHRASIEEDNIHEERRLTYVGITRARRTLSLTLARRRRRYGELVPCDPSRFLAELPSDALVWVGDKSEAAKAESRKRGAQHLAGLRGVLTDPSHPGGT
jgi:ATP-dependent DNA helicase Rep